MCVGRGRAGNGPGTRTQRTPPMRPAPLPQGANNGLSIALGMLDPIKQKVRAWRSRGASAPSADWP